MAETSNEDRADQPSASEPPKPASALSATYTDFAKAAALTLSVLLSFFTIAEVNYHFLQPQSALALFVMFGMQLCFLSFPIHPKLKDNEFFRWVDVLLGVAAASCCAYVFVQTEPLELFQKYWANGSSLANRAQAETQTDIYVGLVGLILVFEATRRAIGLIVPLLALSFVAHSFYCYGAQSLGWPQMQSWMLPHAGQDLQGLVSTTFLQTLGVFGPAAGVMFKYVFLFVVFGAFLEMSGATQFIIDFAERVFGRSPGGPAKVSVLGSGLMGSLSGSAVANAVTTGAFTIPMMRNAGFERHIAGGITAAAASGGALVPPVMGAGAYMMLELVQPQVTFLQVAKAALIPAILYYLSIFLIVHFYSQRIGVQAAQKPDSERGPLWTYEAVVFFGALGVLVGLLVWGFSPFKAVTGSLITILFLSIFRRALKMGTTPRLLALGAFVAGTLVHHFGYSQTVDVPSLRQVFEAWLNSALVGMFCLLVFGLAHSAWRPAILKAFTSSARNGVSLVAASACVGIIIGIVQQTGIANDFSASIRDVVETNLFLALLGITVCSIILGMGVPSVVCYLLMATLMGSLLSELGVIPLSAHLFIFYFGMMSMVTPPVALAAYASASIAEAPIMKTAFAAFRFSLVGFTLPFMFVYRPELTLQSDKPEIKTVSYRQNDGEPGVLRATFQKFGKPVPGSEISLDRPDRDDSVTAVTGLYGDLRTELATGGWTVSLRFPNEQTEEEELRGDPVTYGDSLHIGAIDVYDQVRDPESITDEDKKNFSFAWGRFTDQRLSIVSVITSSGTAVIGIWALAAGLAGFMRHRLNVSARSLLFVAAAFLLYPGVTPISDLIGLLVFLGVSAATWKAASPFVIPPVPEDGARE